MFSMPMRSRPMLSDGGVPVDLYRGALTPDDPAAQSAQPEQLSILQRALSAMNGMDLTGQKAPVPDQPDVAAPDPGEVSPGNAFLATLASGFASAQSHNPAMLENTLTTLAAHRTAHQAAVNADYARRKQMADAGSISGSDQVSVLNTIMRGETQTTNTDKKIASTDKNVEKRLVGAKERAVMRDQTQRIGIAAHLKVAHMTVGERQREFDLHEGLLWQEHGDYLDKWATDRDAAQVTAMGKAALAGKYQAHVLATKYAMAAAGTDPDAQQKVLDTQDENWQKVVDAAQAKYAIPATAPTARPGAAPQAHPAAANDEGARLAEYIRTHQKKK